jgi:hypothetical protein
LDFNKKFGFFTFHVCCSFSCFFLPDLAAERDLLIAWFENQLGFVDLPAAGGVLRG